MENEIIEHKTEALHLFLDEAYIAEQMKWEMEQGCPEAMRND